MSDTKRYTSWFLIAIMLFIGAGVGLNVAMLGLQTHADMRIARAVAGALSQGAYVAFPGNFEDRFLQVEYVSRVSDTPQVVVFGSSRSMQIRAWMFPGASFFNHAAFGSILVDYLGIFALFEEKGRLPQKVVIGVDPWVFNRHSTQSRWWPVAFRSIEQADRVAKADPARNLPSYRTWLFGLFVDSEGSPFANLLSRRQLQDNFSPALRELRRGDSHVDPYQIRADDDTDQLVKRPDGSLRYVKAEREKPLQTLAEEARKFARAKTTYGFTRYDDFDPVSRAYFDAFVSYLTRRNIEVVLFLAPIHPIAYPEIVSRKENRMMVNVENYLKAMSGPRITVAGSYDGRTTGCSPTEYLDAHHPTESCVARILIDAGVVPRDDAARTSTRTD